MVKHCELNGTEIRNKIRNREILLAGNRRLKIYGTLHCKSGRRMNLENRVFFNSMDEAIKNDFRPCGHCMKSEYEKWKNGII